jgi:uncharacterized protein
MSHIVICMNNLFVSDLHGNKNKIVTLFSYIRKVRADAVFLGGDLLPNPLSQNNPMDDFIDEMYLEPIRSIRKQQTTIRFFFILGNDDPRTYEPVFLQADAEGIIDYVHMKTVPYGQYYVTGYACIPPTPFQLKDWERYDVSRFLDVGVISPEEGIHSVPYDPDDTKYGTIKEDLQNLVLHAPAEKTMEDISIMRLLTFI